MKNLAHNASLAAWWSIVPPQCGIKHLVFLDHPGTVEVTNNACERLLRPAVVQRKMTNGYRAMLAAIGEADVRTVVDTARLSGASPFATILAIVA